jgi:hypothetical protein
MTGLASANPTATFDQFTSDGHRLAASVTVNAEPDGSGDGA